VKISLEDSMRLVTGVGSWHTYDCEGKLPSLHLSDGPHGLRKQEEDSMNNNKSNPATCFPASSTVACTWDVESAAIMGEALGREAWNEKVSVVLGPGINIMRSPMCGRNFEYYSEDPFLAGSMAEAYVGAMQNMGVGVSLKHFAGNSQETHRMTQNSQIDERALREIYLYAFEKVVKSVQPATIMASYNRLNGEYACANAHLLTEILKDEWGFEGVVVSDWGACIDLADCLKAGMDLEMPDSLGIHLKRLKKDLADGKISEEEITRASERIQRMVEKYAVENRKGPEKLDISNNHEIARSIARKGAVLLKNDGILPLKPSMKVAVIGSLARHMRIQGGGSSHVNARIHMNAMDALRNVGFNNISFSEGYPENSNDTDNNMVADAVECAKNCEVVLFFGGLTDVTEGEGYDRRNMDMATNQKYLLRKISEVNENIVFVSFGGSPYKMDFIDDCRAILHMGLGGQAVSEACADLISGKYSPSGKLAVTYPKSEKDIPCAGTFASNTDDVEYRESIFVGYRYYDKYKVSVQFPFGYGLSYTAFNYTSMKLSKKSFSGGELTVDVTVKNIGAYTGSEIVQIYVRNPNCKYLRAAKELKGFARVDLEPGEEKTVSIKLDESSFSIFDIKQNKFIMPSGTYSICAAASCADVRIETKIKVEGEEYSEDLTEVLPEYFETSAKLKNLSHESFLRLYGKQTSNFDCVKKGEYNLSSSLNQMSESSKVCKAVMKLAEMSAGLIMPGKRRDDPAVMMMVETLKDGSIDLVTCQSGGLITAAIEEALVELANGHKVRAIMRLIRR